MKKFARVILLDEHSNILVVRQKAGQDRIHCFPGGKVESGERPQCAASREIFEELGIRKSPRDLKPIYRGNFVFGNETWIGYYYLAMSTGLEPNLLEFPKVDLAEFLPPSKIRVLKADQESFSGILAKVGNLIFPSFDNKREMQFEHGFI